MGKGTLTINPFVSNRSLLSPVALSGLFVVLTAFTDSKTCNLILVICSHIWQKSLSTLLSCYSHVSTVLIDS